MEFSNLIGLVPPKLNVLLTRSKLFCTNPYDKELTSKIDSMLMQIIEINIYVR